VEAIASFHLFFSVLKLSLPPEIFSTSGLTLRQGIEIDIGGCSHIRKRYALTGEEGGVTPGGGQV
jgi:hypothetical protein